MILGVHHAALAVPDIEAALRFYCDLVGFEVVMEAELPAGIDVMSDALGIDDSSFKVRMIKKGNSCIELFEFGSSQEGETQRPANRIGITHIALASNEIAGDYDNLAANGVVFNAALLGSAPSRFAYGRDPFGNVIELLEHNPQAQDSLVF
jgi:catechol 2,3-dioxygenase-like lactoylglutathione lyase family enzyme